MIYVTGDTHGEADVFQAGAACRDKALKENDILIVCGDFGYIFFGEEREEGFLDFLATKPYTICFCDGNHESFTLLKQYPEEEWNGGRVHRIRSNILHLMRGQVFTIEGKKVFTMGGAYSIDKHLRKEGYSWWSDEKPNDAEYKEAIRNLHANNMQVEYVITHTAPAEIIRRMGYIPDPHDAELTGFLEWIMYEVKYKEWFFGHWHEDRDYDRNLHGLWLDVMLAQEAKR